MVSIEYANAYSEVVEILKHVSEEEYNKIPKDKIELFEKNRNKDLDFVYDESKTLDEQNVSKIAKTIIAILFRDYWATDKQRNEILAKEQNDRKIQNETTFNYDDLFKSKHKENDTYEDNENIVSDDLINDDNQDKDNNKIIEYKKENIFTKLFNKLIHVFKK